MGKYEDALDRFKEWERKHPNGYVIEEMAKYVFPDLAESEEEDMWRTIMNQLGVAYANNLSLEEDFDKMCAFIEKKKEQQPAEWSEEDEKIRQDLIEYLVGGEPIHNPYLTAQKSADWLKSLRPQPHWKPSEEQMNALDKARNGNVNSAFNLAALDQLYIQLQKLM